MIINKKGDKIAFCDSYIHVFSITFFEDIHKSTANNQVLFNHRRIVPRGLFCPSHNRSTIYHKSSTSMSMLPFTCQRFAGAYSRRSWSLLNKMLFQEPCAFNTWKSASA